jgi:hypothetical protein
MPRPQWLGLNRGATRDSVEATGGRPAIGRLGDAVALLAGTAGTIVSLP